MIISDYFQALGQIKFSSDTAQKRVLTTFSDALKGYMKNPATGGDGAANKLNNFYFDLPVMEVNTFEDPEIKTEDMFVIAKVNQEVVEAELNRLFKENGISNQYPATFEIDKFGQLTAGTIHPQTEEIMVLINKDPALKNRIISALSDTAQSAHQAQVDMLEHEIGELHGSSAKKALLHEKDRLVVPRAQITLWGGQTSFTLANMKFDTWLLGRKNLLDQIVLQNETEQLSLLRLLS